MSTAINPTSAEISMLDIAKHVALYVLTISPSAAKPHAEAVSAFSPPLLWGTRISLYLGLTGAGIGAYLTGRQRNHQFLAENAHRLPKTQRGWFMYHRHKQLQVINAAMSWKGAFGSFSKFAGMGAVFCGIETFCEHRLTGNRECWVNAVVAGTASGALFAVGARLSLQSSKYALAMGAGTGLAIGLLEDVSAFVSGVSVKYPSRLRSGSLDFWIPGWDWERGVQGLGVFRAQIIKSF